MKLTVLHISPAPPQLGGMETYMGELLQSSLRQKVNLQHLDISKPALQKGGSYGVDTGYAAIRNRGLSRSAVSYGYSFVFFLRFLKMSLTERIDILHIHTASYTSFWEKSLYILIGRLTGKKTVLHIHGALFDEFFQNSSDRSKKLIKAVIAQCNAVIVLSQSWRLFFQALLPTTDFHVVENGINLTPYLQLQPHFGVSSFLHIGEISRRKGIEDVLAAFAEINKLGYDFHLHLAGGGERERYRDMIYDLGLTERVTLHGPVRGAAKLALFAQSNVFVLASYAEGLPIALIEALAAGLAVQSTTVGGIPDVIEHGVHGFLCNPGDRTALQEAFMLMVREPQLVQNIGDVNRRYALERFDIERCVRQIVKVYNVIARAR